MKPGERNGEFSEEKRVMNKRYCKNNGNWTINIRTIVIEDEMCI